MYHLFILISGKEFVTNCCVFSADFSVSNQTFNAEFSITRYIYYLEFLILVINRNAILIQLNNTVGINTKLFIKTNVYFNSCIIVTSAYFNPSNINSSKERKDKCKQKVQFRWHQKD